MSGIEIDREYWSDRLEVDVDAVLDYFEDEDYMTRWSPLVSSRCRTILAEQLGLDNDMAKRDMVVAAPHFGEEVLPFMLVDEVRKRKAEIVIRKVAEEQLSSEEFEACKYGDDNFDRTAAMWYLYLDDPVNLERVFFLDIIHRKGYARMVLTREPENEGAEPDEFFTRDTLNPLIEAYDRTRRDHRTGHCAEILSEYGRTQVIVRRDFAHARVRKAGEIFHGYSTEWIILEFYPGLSRVDVCSVSPDVPTQLANRIASAYFEEDVRYRNEVQYVSGDVVREFLDSFREEKPLIPLLELQFKNSAITGSPEVRLKVEKDSSLAPALVDYEVPYGNPFDELDDIVGMKVLIAGKICRIKLDKDEHRSLWVVRYEDQRLSPGQKDEFESQMMDEFNIPVLSTEKKRAR